MLVLPQDHTCIAPHLSPRCQSRHEQRHQREHPGSLESLLFTSLSAFGHAQTCVEKRQFVYGS